MALNHPDGAISVSMTLINGLSLHLGMRGRLWRDIIVLSTWRQGEHVPLILVVVCILLSIVHGARGTWHAVRPVRSILRSLDHGWQLQLLVV